MGAQHTRLRNYLLISCFFLFCFLENQILHMSADQGPERMFMSLVSLFSCAGAPEECHPHETHETSLRPGTE